MQPGPQEVEPLVYDGIMFLANAEDIVQALDATTGDLLWDTQAEAAARDRPPDGDELQIPEYRDLRRQDLSRDQRCLPDCARRKVRKGPLGDPARGLQRSSGPDDRARSWSKGKLLNGSRCNPSSPLPGGCFISAHEAEFGEFLWRVNVIARPGEPGGETWGGLPIAARRHASAWMPGSYDPELNLVYWGTGVTAPVPEKLRGAGKATCCIRTPRSRSTPTRASWCGTSSTCRATTGTSIIPSKE